MILVDDFLTRRYWDSKPYPHGLGTNIPLDYNAMTVEEELDAIKKLKDTGLDFTVFVVGHVLELAETDENVRGAIQWLVDNNIRIGAHGYYHTETEYLDGYEPWAEMALELLKKYQKPPYLWRYPREEGVNEEYIRRLGFTICKSGRHLDPQLLVEGLGALQGREGHCHSMYLAKIMKRASGSEQGPMAEKCPKCGEPMEYVGISDETLFTEVLRGVWRSYRCPKCGEEADVFGDEQVRGDYIGRSAGKIRIYNVEVTNHCNSACEYCAQPKMKREKGFMSMETYKKVLKRQEMPNLVLHGFGEPLLHPQITEFVRMGKAAGFRVEFSTNGLLLDRGTASGLVGAGVDEIRISMRPFFDEMCERLKSLEDFKSRIRLLYIEYPQKRRPLPQGWKATIYSPHDWAGQVDIPCEKTGGACNPMRLGAVTVLWDGRVANCCVDAEGDYILGTLDDSDLRPKRIPLCGRCAFG